MPPPHRPSPVQAILATALLVIALTATVLAFGIGSPAMPSQATAPSPSSATSGAMSGQAPDALATGIAALVLALTPTATVTPVPTRRSTATFVPCPSYPSNGGLCWHNPAPTPTAILTPVRLPVTATPFPACTTVTPSYSGWCRASSAGSTPTPTPGATAETPGGDGMLAEGEERIGDE